VKNGIYGAMFCSAMIAAAYVLDEPIKIVEAGLAEIPRTSRLYEEMRQVIDIARRHRMDPRAFEPALDDLHELLGHYHPVHTNNNAGAVALALLMGGEDLERVITIAVMAGWDTDCNGATAGSICGAMVGAKHVPAKWAAPLHDTLNSAIIGYHPITIGECAKRSLAIAQKVRG
jgi:ADP-ribosylglycohydrolase